MRRPAAVVLATAGLFVLGGPAAAKGPVSLSICGASQCTNITRPRRIESALPASTDLTGTPTPPASFYRLELKIGAHGHRYTRRMYVVPSTRVFRGSNDGNAYWSRLTRDAAASFRRLTRAIEPFPAPTVLAAIVDGRQVSGDPSTYLRLFSLPVAEYPAPTVSDWIPIDLRSAAPSPWTDGRSDLAYSGEQGVLERGGWIIELPADLADDIATARAVSEGGNRFPWSSSVVMSAVIAALALALSRLARKRTLRHLVRPRASGL